jgi:5-methylcytosine-specific restriction protein B
MRVLTGAPGTGKTYRAAEEAVFAIDGVAPTNRVELVARHAQLVALGRIIWVTFHPSYSYEDFVEGFRPVRDESGQLTYEVVDGPFKLACERCMVPRPESLLRVGDSLGSGRYVIEAVESGGVALRSDVDRRDAIVPSIVQFVDFWTINRLRGRGVLPTEISVAGSDNEVKQEFTRKTEIPSTWLANSSPNRAVYEKILELEAGATAQAVVLVIDEINRADLSRVFGELLTLVEVDKRGGAAEERSIMLPYSRENFSVPAELSIVGTMNTADKSLSVIDLALRRRFEFIELEPRPDLCPASYGGLDVGGLLRRVNERMSALLSRDNRIGHSEFMEVALERTRVQRAYPDDGGGKARAAAHAIRHRLLPLLLEYFHDDWRLADVVLGRAGLLDQVSFPGLDTLAGDLVDVSDVSSFAIANWWDPDHADWDLDKFMTAVKA